MVVISIKDLRSCGWKFFSDGEQLAGELQWELLRKIGLTNLRTESFYLICNGKILSSNEVVRSCQPVYMVPRLPGGKGGFGSMLRAIGAQIEKTTNREACRDLSGRRLRDINEEMRLKKWINKQSERDQEKVTRRRERLERKLATPKHEFSDPAYDRQRSELEEKVNDALTQGLATVSSVKRSAPSEKNAATKKRKIWLDVDDELSDSSTMSESEQEPESSRISLPPKSDSQKGVTVK